jgi:hypothetical protein
MRLPRGRVECKDDLKHFTTKIPFDFASRQAPPREAAGITPLEFTRNCHTPVHLPRLVTLKIQTKAPHRSFSENPTAWATSF